MAPSSSQHANPNSGSHTRLLSKSWWFLCKPMPPHWSKAQHFFPDYCTTLFPGLSLPPNLLYSNLFSNTRLIFQNANQILFFCLRPFTPTKALPQPSTPLRPSPSPVSLNQAPAPYAMSQPYWETPDTYNVPFAMLSHCLEHSYPCLSTWLICPHPLVVIASSEKPSLISPLHDSIPS